MPRSGPEEGLSQDFRPDIQALRALAVGAVLLYHLWPGLLPGGYVGVDVFFVVSGFLITGLLVRELETTGRVDLLGFYARRIRRLLPCALLVLAVTYAALMLLVPPVLWTSNLGDLAAACTYVLNWVLAATNADYLAADATPSLVQHYWSLSLEEQFYLVWPVLLVVAVAASRPLHIGRRAGTGTALSVLLVISFALSVQMTAERPEVAFYLPHVRAWEFALGGLVALVPVFGAPAPVVRALRVVGLSAMGVSCLAFSDATAFPGWVAAIPTAGAALMIAAGSLGPTPAPMAARAVQWVGDHSYGIYLWHWPPLVVLPWVLHGPLGLDEKVGVLALTFGLAWTSKKYVEDPIRAGRLRAAQLAPTYAFAVTAALAIVMASFVTLRHVDSLSRLEAAMAAEHLSQGRSCFGAAAVSDPACERPFARPSERTIAFAYRDYSPALNTCQLGADEPADPRWCRFGARRGHRSTVAVVGNSFATQLVPMVREWSSGRRTRILLAARTDCLGVTTETVRGQSDADRCVAWTRKVHERLLRIDDLSLVVFATHLAAAEFLTGRPDPDDTAVAQARSHMATTLRRFKDAGVATAVFKHPPGPWSVPAPVCVAADEDTDGPCSQLRGPMTGSDLMASFARTHPRLTEFVSLDRFVCHDLMCHPTVGGVVAYFDEQHLSTTFARSLAHPLASRLDEAVGEVSSRSSRRDS